MSYNVSEIEDLLDVFTKQDLGSTIMEVNMSTIVTHSLWFKKFENVISVALGLRGAFSLAPYVARNRSKIIIGMPWEVSTMKEICGNIENLDALFIDSTRYSVLMPCYVIYSKLVRLGGVIAFANSCSTEPEYQYIVKFIDDLRSGYVDGYQHEIHDIQRGRVGFSYEIKHECRAINVYDTKIPQFTYKKLRRDTWMVVYFCFESFKWIIRKLSPQS